MGKFLTKNQCLKLFLNINLTFNCLFISLLKNDDFASTLKFRGF